MTSEEKIEEILHNHKNDPKWFMAENGYSEREALKEICDWKGQEMINKALSCFCDAACGGGICKIKCDSVCDKRRYFESVMTGKPVDTGIIAFDESVGTIFDI